MALPAYLDLPYDGLLLLVSRSVTPADVFEQVPWILLVFKPRQAHFHGKLLDFDIRGRLPLKEGSENRPLEVAKHAFLLHRPHLHLI